MVARNTWWKIMRNRWRNWCPRLLRCPRLTPSLEYRFRNYFELIVKIGQIVTVPKAGQFADGIRRQ